MQAVILAAGRGERLRPVTDHLAKPLIPFWGRPFLSYVLDNLEGVVEEAIIVDGPAGAVVTTLGDRHGALPIRYATQPVPRGTGDALLQAAELLHGPFLLLLGDTCPSRTTLEELIAEPGDIALTAIKVDDPENHLGIDVGANGRIRAIWVESATVDAGVFRFPPEILPALAAQAPLRGELRVLQGVARLMEEGADARAVLMSGPWLQFGDHEGLPGVLRVMRRLGATIGIDPGVNDSSVMVETHACTITNSLVFGPGRLIDCTIRDSMVYCGAPIEGATIKGEIAALA